MSNAIDLVKYLECGFRMRLWVARGRTDRAIELFNRLEPEVQSFRSFRKVKQAIAEDESGLHGRLEKLFDPTLLLEKSMRFQPWKRKRADSRFEVK